MKDLTSVFSRCYGRRSCFWRNQDALQACNHHMLNSVLEKLSAEVRKIILGFDLAGEFFQQCLINVHARIPLLSKGQLRRAVTQFKLQSLFMLANWCGWAPVSVRTRHPQERAEIKR